MKNLGPARQILGMDIIRDRSKKQLWLSQVKYVTKVLQQFNMLEAKLVGSTLIIYVDDMLLFVVPKFRTCVLLGLDHGGLGLGSKKGYR